MGADEDEAFRSRNLPRFSVRGCQVSPYQYKEIQEMINSGDFSSESDICYQALSCFVAAYKKEKKK